MKSHFLKRRSINLLVIAAMLVAMVSFVPVAMAQEEDPEAPEVRFTYTVVSGDTLSEIAVRFNTTVDALMQVNPVIENPNFIVTGQVINIPDPVPVTAPPFVLEPGQYLVQRGDTLSEIAFLHGTTVEAMMEANPEIENSNLIVTGQVLEIADPVPVTAPPFVLEPGQYLVQRGDTLSEIAFLHGTTVEAMMEANPHIENASLIVTGQVLEIADPVPVTAPPFVLEPGQYLVQSGDTLSEIAFQHGTTVEAMMEANPEIENPNFIVTGQVLEIADPVPLTALPGQYIVQPGDTLSEIAFHHGTTVEAMMEANPHIANASLIVTGQVLTVADPVPVTAPPLAPNQYVVQPGDTLSEIAFRHGTTVEAMMEANPHIEHPSLIVTGQVLTIADPVPVDNNEEGDG